MSERFHKVLVGDCLKILPTLTERIDAVVTDPPFGIGFKYASHNDTPEDYGPWLWAMIEAAEALCNPGSPVFVWQAMPNVRRFSEWFPRDWRLFAACKNFVQIRPAPMQFSFDPVVVWWTDGDRHNGKGGRDWHIADTTPSGREPVVGHPCPRPLPQVQYIIDGQVRPGGTVLDPFGGSGTTAVAAKLTGRNSITIESDEGYAAIARRRIAEAASLFHQEPA